MKSSNTCRTRAVPAIICAHARPGTSSTRRPFDVRWRFAFGWVTMGIRGCFVFLEWRLGLGARSGWIFLRAFVLLPPAALCAVVDDGHNTALTQGLCNSGGRQRNKQRAGGRGKQLEGQVLRVCDAGCGPSIVLGEMAAKHVSTMRSVPCAVLRKAVEELRRFTHTHTRNHTSACVHTRALKVSGHDRRAYAPYWCVAGCQLCCWGQLCCCIALTKWHRMPAH